MKRSRRYYREIKNYIQKKRKRTKRRPMVLLAILIIAAILIGWGVLASRNLVVRSFGLSLDTLPDAFDGYRIVQLSDLHGRIFGEDQDRLIDLVEDQAPDIILLTGDMLDAHDTQLDACTKLCEGLVNIAPVMWVKGNHFHKMKTEGVDNRLHDALTSMGVVSLDDAVIPIERDGESIYLCGLDDPQKYYPLNKMPAEYAKKVVKSQLNVQLDNIQDEVNEDDFCILLRHRPGNAELVSERGYDLMLAGHTHGGQLCLPGGIEIVGEYIEIFPDVKSGYNDIDGMPLVISSGLGYSNMKLRLYNPPEIVVITLETEKELG